MILVIKKLKYLIVVFILVIFLLPASNFSLNTNEAYADKGFLKVTPQIIDIKAKQREITEHTITLTSTATRRLNVYTFVEDLFLDSSQDVADSPNVSSLRKWINIPMGVIDLDPGQSHKINWEIRTSSVSKPGIYHVAISFGQGSTREIAKSNGYEAYVTVNFEILSNVKENLQLKYFIANSSVFLARAPEFSFDLENAGNTELEPSGQIRIYDRKGKELGAIDINSQNSILSEGELGKFEASWDYINLFGRYKAVLDLNYGKDSTKNIQDTVFFWSLSWKGIVVSLGVLFFLMFLLVFFIHRKVVKRIHKQIKQKSF